MIEIFTPKSREEWLDLRKDAIGASEVAAVLGVHPYMTTYELWAKKGGCPWPGLDTVETKAMRRGRLLEDDCIEILREERPEWEIIHNTIPALRNAAGQYMTEAGYFYRDLAIGISATPDAFVCDPDTVAYVTPPSEGAVVRHEGHPGEGVCQIKTVNEHAFRAGWMADGVVAVPTYIAVQAIQEAHLTGASWACVAAFVGMDLEPHILDVDLHSGVMDKIRHEVPEFLRRVRENDPPPPDYARDGDRIRARYAEDDGGEVDLSANEHVRGHLARRVILKGFEDAGAGASAERREIDAELIHLLGNATRGNLGDGRYIEAKTVRRRECVHPASTSRPVKIKQRKSNG